MNIIHTESSCGWGGQEIRIINESLVLQDRGNCITIVCSKQSQIYHEAKSKNLNVKALPIERKNIKGVIALSKWLSIQKIEVINTHSSTDSWLVALAKLFNKKINVPIVRTRHISAPISKNIFTKWLYTKATDFIITTGEKLRESLIEENKYNPEKIQSIRTGIDTTIFIPTKNKKQQRNSLNLPEKTYIIGIVATIRSWKGHTYLLEAFSKLTNKNVKLLIVGDGPMFNPVHNQAKQLGITNKVIMTGNQKNVAKWLQSMDLFVLPSYANEGVPQALMQAMASGLPVISTNVGSISEIIKHQETGIIVPTKNSDELANQIKSVMENKNYAHKLGNNAYQWASKNCDIHHMADKMEKIFTMVTK